MTSPRKLGRVRSVLFAPAVRPDFLAKLPGRGADLVVIDCEDATPANAKAEGRENARNAISEIAAAGQAVTVRINAVASEWWADDIARGLTDEVAAVMLPKADSVEGLDQVAAALDAAGLTEVGIIAGLETVLGVADARPVLAHPRVVGAYFGAEDYIVDLGGVRTDSNDEVAYGRAATSIAARLAGVPVLDQVVTAIKDDDRFTRESNEARAMGYTGKLCIHPQQVALANELFVPSEAEVTRATALLAAYDEAVAGGLAAIAFEGQMVDEPLAAQARRIIALAEG